MDSQLYIVINANIQLGQAISKQLAQKGNTVFYLGNDEQEGYAITADEPRVRYRYCPTNDRIAIANEFDWIKRNVAPIDSIVVLVPEMSIQHVEMPLEESYFASLLDCSNGHVAELPLTYLIAPSAATDSDESLKALHLALCQLSHQKKDRMTGMKVNHIVITNKPHPRQACPSIDNDVSDLIHYLSSQQANAIRHQIFFLQVQ